MELLQGPSGAKAPEYSGVSGRSSWGSGIGDREAVRNKQKSTGHRGLMEKRESTAGGVGMQSRCRQHPRYSFLLHLSVSCCRRPFTRGGAWQGRAIALPLLEAPGPLIGSGRDIPRSRYRLGQGSGVGHEGAGPGARVVSSSLAVFSRPVTFLGFFTLGRRNSSDGSERALLSRGASVLT